MTDRTKRTSGTLWGAAAWAVGVLAVLAGLPPAASSRLPERLATHWGEGAPDGSMPLWVAAVFPALVWAVLVLSIAIAGRRAGAPARAWIGVSLLSGGVFLAGAQASIVRANLDRAEWRDAGSVGVGMAITAAVAVVAGVLGWFAGRRVERPV